MQNIFTERRMYKKQPQGDESPTACRVLKPDGDIDLSGFA